MVAVISWCTLDECCYFMVDSAWLLLFPGGCWTDAVISWGTPGACYHLPGNRMKCKITCPQPCVPTLKPKMPKLKMKLLANYTSCTIHGDIVCVVASMTCRGKQSQPRCNWTCKRIQPTLWLRCNQAGLRCTELYHRFAITSYDISQEPSGCTFTTLLCMVHVLSNAHGTKVTNLQLFNYTQFCCRLS